MSQNFEVNVVYCCPCVLDLVRFEISRRNVLTQVLLTDFICARFNSSILIELFQSTGIVLITCTKYLIENFCFDWKWCNHYNKRTFFSIFFEQ